MQERNHSLRSQLTNMNLILVITTALLAFAGTMILTLRMEFQAIETNLTNSALVLSQLPQVRRVVTGETDADWLTDYLDETISAVDGIDLIMVADREATLLYTPQKEHIGSTYSGSSWKDTLKGERYVMGAEGLETAERCAFVPVEAEDGTVVGFVAVGIYTRSIRALVGSTILQFLVVAAAACILGILLSRRMTRRIKHTLMGYEPDDFRRLFHRQEVVLESLEEGIVAIDRSGRIIYINSAAVKLFGLKSREAAVGHSAKELKQNSTLSRLLKTGRPEHNVSINDLPGGRVLSDRLPIYQDGKVAGAVAIFRDRTEMTRLAENLTGVQHMVEAMRAYTHEFMNKLHVIHGLLQMGKTDMAEEYIMEITHTQHQAVSRVMDRIGDPTTAALLVGKTSRAAELGIRLILEPGSALSADCRFLPSAVLVTILGNLLDNAIESLNLSGCPLKEITVTIREDQEGLFLCVEDTGPGISSTVMPHIFETGFSTKGEERGTGLSLVKELTDSYHGQIRVETELDVGAVFYVTFHGDQGEEGKA